MIKKVLLQKQKYQSSKEILELLKYRFGIGHSIERIEAYDNSFLEIITLSPLMLFLMKMDLALKTPGLISLKTMI